MQIKLKHIAMIYSGITVRESIHYIANGNMKFLQPSNLTKGLYEFNADSLTGINWKVEGKQQCLQHNDIVFLARGEPSAYIFKGNKNDNVLVGHIFIVIRLNTELVIPEYLVWYLNKSLVAKKHFEQNIKGVNLMMTSIATIKEMPIIIPSKEEQENILLRQQQIIDETKAFNQLIKLHQEYNNALDNQIIFNIQNEQKNSEGNPHAR